MRMYFITAALALMASVASAAVWERPAGAYTPTNHSVNTTKYQTDRSNGVAISSAKVDGDVNKAFEGLNSLESRVAPNVVGQGGKYLTNNGSTASWSFISPSSISSGAATAGQVLKANGSGATVFGLLDTTSFPNQGVAGTWTAPTLTLNSAGFVTSVTASQVISASGLNASNSLIVSGSTTLSGTTTINGAVTVSSTFNGPSSRAFARAWVNFDGTGAIGAAQTIRTSYNVSQVTKVSGAVYSVSFTTAMPDDNYLMSGSMLTDGGSVGIIGIDNAVANSPSAARVKTIVGTGLADGKYVSAIFHGN
ncbi:hypothetical protein GFL93_09395 [Rhizobium leguminosarum bv. viciae]|uniref:hypothetical protein n=1 Tax=Rhizobium TaxID=379 RepID=UPI00144185A6|nr:hypothetical protein [Rhizobium leguminosarum]NKK06085.1 hypothetical protein [Rhizobium leguminosarum bv. viciae]